ncbi:hypothetical protein [Paenibacillus farraposensis]|uniref:hypothetical protein n=1 Tax=Paenibacillus farraposensis TaxID=2807095 RepID=UPI001E4CCD97|nr:hypothetical protein [Paenibacillus farraposensis]
MAILVIAMPSIAVSYGSPIYYSLLYVAYFIGRRFYRHHQCTADAFDSNYYTAAVTGTCYRLS